MKIMMNPLRVQGCCAFSNIDTVSTTGKDSMERLMMSGTAKKNGATAEVEKARLLSGILLDEWCHLRKELHCLAADDDFAAGHYGDERFAYGAGITAFI